MGTIVYKPHCSKCGAVINEQISYRNMVFGPTSNNLLAQQWTDVFPTKCKYCNQPFNAIEIPMPGQEPTEYLM